MGIYSSILMQRPDFEELRKKGMTAVDMHYHSRFSDTYTKVARIIAKAERIGCGVAITDHNAIGGAKRALKLKDGIMVIPGIETSSREGPHILSYFDRFKDLEGYYEDCVKENLAGDPYCRIDSSVADIIRCTKEHGGLISAAHPHGPAMMGLYKAVMRKYIHHSLIPEFDAFEVMTGVNVRLMTAKSIAWAKKHSMGITGGSDGHSLRELGNVVTYSKATTPKKFLQNIRDKKNRVMGKETRLAARVPSYTMTANKHLKYIRPFISSKARCVMHESFYYHTHLVNDRLVDLAVKGALMVNRKTNGLPGKVARMVNKRTNGLPGKMAKSVAKKGKQIVGNLNATKKKAKRVRR
jgi:predicted metal-dependent phosphoesterase TrpH